MDMMVFLKRYGFLFIPPVYWFIYLGARLTYNGLAGSLLLSFSEHPSRWCVYYLWFVGFLFLLLED
jgi:hypothetical protein